jgi:thioredoxin-like negative regulator of GroEL
MIVFEPPEYADLVHQGNELMEQKQYRDAVAKYAQAIQMSPSSTVAIYDMGLALDKLCDPQAEQFYRIAANMGDSNASRIIRTRARLACLNAIWTRARQAQPPQSPL